MGKNLTELRATVKAWIGIDEEDSDERLPDNVIDDLLNWAISDYLRRKESHFGENTTVFQTVIYNSGYIYPDGFSRPRKLWYLNGGGKFVALTKLNKDEF